MKKWVDMYRNDIRKIKKKTYMTRSRFAGRNSFIHSASVGPHAPFQSHIGPSASRKTKFSPPNPLQKGG